MSVLQGLCAQCYMTYHLCSLEAPISCTRLEGPPTPRKTGLGCKEIAGDLPAHHRFPNQCTKPEQLFRTLLYFEVFMIPLHAFIPFALAQMGREEESLEGDKTKL